MRLLATCILLTCALSTNVASAQEGALEYRADTGPLRYDISVEQLNTTDTPIGVRGTSIRTSAVVVLEIGGQEGDGLLYSAVFESLHIEVGDQSSVEVDAVIGMQFTGVLANDGLVLLRDGPELPAQLRSVFDPERLLAELLPALPPVSGSKDGAWTVEREYSSEGTVSITSVFQGKARVVGDTTWNGLKANLIVGTGTVGVLGGGAPADAPAEIDIIAGGEFTERHIFEAERGIVLASAWESESTGFAMMTEMDIEMPYRQVRKGIAELRRQTNGHTSGTEHAP